MKNFISRKNILKIVCICFALVSIFLWISQIDGLLTKDYAVISRSVILDDAWDITINDDAYTDVSLTELHFPSVGKGDVITMQRTLPADWEFVEGALRFYIRHSAVRMYIDDELVYEYGSDRLAKGRTLGSGCQFIKFPNEYLGKRLRIELVVTEDKVFTKFDPVRIYEWENAYRVLITENRLPLFCGSFLIIFGLIVSVITIVALFFSTKYVRLFCIALFASFMGMWSLSYYNIMQIFAIPLYSISLIKYLTFYLAPVPLIVYIRDEVANLKYRPLKVFYWVYLVVDVAAVSAVILLHVLNIVHFEGVLKYMQGLMFCGVLYFLLVLLINLKSAKLENRLPVLGLLIFICCAVYDMLRYNSERYLGMAYFKVSGVSSSGIMIFICIMFVSFYIKMTQKMMQQKERDFLIKSAYTDELTQLHNRRYCMEYMNKLKEERNFKYTVICFDLNNLKTVNDTYGHAKGDVLIRSAAEVLAETFGNHGVVARMGGDEFVSVIGTADQDKLMSLMEQFQQNIDKKNRAVKDLNMSIAYGYASGSQSDSDIEKVYQLADDRMYEKKKQMKGTREGGHKRTELNIWKNEHGVQSL